MIDAALALVSEEARFDSVAAGCLAQRGAVAAREGDSAAVLKAAEAALARLDRVPSAFSALRANVLQMLASAHQMRGEIGLADRTFAQAMEQLEGIGRDRTADAATLLNDWALNRAFTNTLGALALQQRALENRQQPTSLGNYGRLLNRLTRYSEAIPVYERSRDTARRHQNIRVVGTASLGLARAYRSLGDLERAQRSLDEAEPALRAYFSAGHHHSLADLSREQGLLAADRGDAEAARRLLSEALAIHEKASEKHVTHIETLLERANLSLRTNDLDDAEKHAHAALSMAQGLQAGTTHSSWVGLSQLALGMCREARGDPEAARTLYREALTHMPATLGEAHPAVQEARTRLAASRS
jgi:tetratricopeptide (TPR) repeat protein